MAYKVYGLSSLCEVLGEYVVYRNLVPSDRRLPALCDLQEKLGLEKNAIPRKAEPDYGRVVAEMLRHARAASLPGAALKTLLYVGDTELNDGTAFHNIGAAGGWSGRMTW